MVNSTTTLIGNTIVSNTAGENGGGIDLVDSAATLTSNTVSGIDFHPPNLRCT